ncbi:S41 family peptidase [Mucilaginibacter sp. HD30]
MKPIQGDPANVSLSFTGAGTACLRIRAFAGDSFTQEVDSVLRLITQNKTKGLVLDLRGNGGGLDELGAYLAAKFVTRPFRYIDHIHARVLVPTFADWKQQPPVDLVNGIKSDPKGGYLVQPMLNQTLALQQASAHPYTGKLVILINGRTFSAASDFCAIIKNLTGVFVGEETGGGYEGNTSALNVILTLPNSGFKANIHLWEYWSAVKPPKIKGRGVIPDYEVRQKPFDLINGIDKQYAFALDLCRK